MFSLTTAPGTYSHAEAYRAMSGRWVVRCAECSHTVAALPNAAAAMDVLSEHNREAHGNPCGCSWPCGAGDH